MNISKYHLKYILKQKQNNFLNTNILFDHIEDDCIYRYFVCTERSGKWPNNKEKCTLLFKRCCEYIENDHYGVIHPILLSTTTKPSTAAEGNHNKLIKL